MGRNVQPDIRDMNMRPQSANHRNFSPPDQHTDDTQFDPEYIHQAGQDNGYYLEQEEEVTARLQQLLDEASLVVHVPRDTSHFAVLSHLSEQMKEQLRQHQETRQGSEEYSMVALTNMKEKMRSEERERYDIVFRNNLTALLRGLDIANPEQILSGCATMEDVAFEIRKRIAPTTASAEPTKYGMSTRTIKPATEELDDTMRENKRLKELVVKLQYEINENIKKSSDERIKILYEEINNHQRKIADLIDQLKRKEQEILLIPVGKAGQTRIDALEKEKAALLGIIEDMKKKHAEEVADLKEKLRFAGKQRTEIATSLQPSVNLDMAMFATVLDQKKALEDLSLSIQRLRTERDALEQSLKDSVALRASYEDYSRKLEAYLLTVGVNPQELMPYLDLEGTVPQGPEEFEGDELDSFEKKKEFVELKQQMDELRQRMPYSSAPQKPYGGLGGHTSG